MEKMKTHRCSVIHTAADGEESDSSSRNRYSLNLMGIY